MSSAATKKLYGPCATVFESGKTGTWRIVRPSVLTDTCILCGICEKYCPAGVITVAGKKEENPGLTIMMDYCKGCGICANVCPKQAMKMVPEREESNV